MPYSRRKFIQTSTGALAGLSLWGCGREPAPAGPEAAASRTTVFLNGTVLPVDATFTEQPVTFNCASEEELSCAVRVDLLVEEEMRDLLVRAGLQEVVRPAEEGRELELARAGRQADDARVEVGSVELGAVLATEISNAHPSRTSAQLHMLAARIPVNEREITFTASTDNQWASVIGNR